MRTNGPRALRLLLAASLLVSPSAPYAQVIAPRPRAARAFMPAPAPSSGGAPRAFAALAGPAPVPALYDGARAQSAAPRAAAAVPALPPGAALAGGARLSDFGDAAREAAARGAMEEAWAWSRLAALRELWGAEDASDRGEAAAAAALTAGGLRRGLYREVSAGLAADPGAVPRRRQADALSLLGPAAGSEGELRAWLREHLEPASRDAAAARSALPELRRLLGRAVEADEAAAARDAAEGRRRAAAVLARRGAAAALPSKAGAAGPALLPSAAAAEKDEALGDAARRAESAALRVGLGRAAVEAAADAPSREAARAALDGSVEDLRRARDDLDLLGKLGQRAGLSSDAPSPEADAVDALVRRYDGVLLPSEGRNAALDPGEAGRAAVEAARRRLTDLLSGTAPRAPADAPPPLGGTPLEADLLKRLDRIAALEARAQGELSQRDASAQMLALADRLRGGALRERRSGREQLEFRKNFARLAMVMDLSYSLNVITAAEKAIAGMQALLDEKLSSIDARRQASREAAEAARRGSARRAEWDKAVADKIASDKSNEGLFTRLGDQAARLTDRLGRYKSDVKGLLGLIDARDRGRSASAVAEYDRRLALLPALVEWRTHGYADAGDSLGKLSLDRLNSEVRRAEDYLAKVRAGEDKLDAVPVEFAGVLVVAVPGVPAAVVTNPDAATTLRLLSERREYWAGQRADFKRLLDGVETLLDPAETGREADDFGDSVPKSAAVYRAEERRELEAARADAERFARDLDAVSRLLAEAGGSLPPLSGRSVQDLKDTLGAWADALSALKFSDDEAGTRATIEKISAARLVPFLADAVARACEAEAKVKALDDALGRVLPAARRSFQAAVAGTDALLADVEADEAYVRSGFPAAQGQSLIDRKRRLLASSLKPMLEGLRTLLSDTLIPYQRDSIKTADPSSSGDGYATLYKEKKNLFVRIRDSYEKTMPWSLATNGAPEGDAAAGRAGVEEQRRRFTEYRTLANDYLDEVRRHKDPNGVGSEEVYGESMPVSLPKRIAQYREENARRAAEIDRIAGEVNAILAEVDTLTGGRHALASRYRLPTDIKANDPDSSKRLKAMADSKVIQNMASALKAIGEEAQAAAGDSGLGVGGSGGVAPVGTQPSPQLSGNQRVAVLALDAVKRLVPSSLTGGGAALTEAMARYLFADGVAEASRDSLENQLPLFEAFLTRAQAVLDAVFADLETDLGYVAGSGEGGAALFGRKESLYGRVRDVAGEGASLFRQKQGWDRGSYDTVASIADYYGTLEEVYARSDEALDAEAKAAQTYRDALKKTADELAAQRAQVVEWLRQLDDPRETAMNRVGQSLSRLQERTRAVLEANVSYAEARDRYEGSEKTLKATLEEIERERAGISAALKGVDLGDLPEETARRVEALGLGGSAWLSAGPRARGALVVRKSDFASFLTQLFGAFEPDSSARDVVRLREELLKNPLALTQLLPNSRMLQLGDDPNGFYLVYDSMFSTPHGLETSSQVTLGNVLRLWDSNVSVTGHRFMSPPNAGNAPYGDQGVTVSVETLGDNAVNYLDVTLHKFIQDIPSDASAQGQAREARMMVFDDFAVMLAGDKLYFGAAGFADFALTDGKDKPYYYGGNAKASIKFNEVMRLNAEETRLFAKDPRKFLQTINLDFTKYDPALDRDFIVDARGTDRQFQRDRVGVGVDLAKAMDQAHTFTVDFFVERVRGTADTPNDALGATIVKGFAFEVGGVPVRTELSGTGTIGTQYDSASVRASFELPQQGIVLSATGKSLGDASTYMVELRKRFGDSSEAFLSYGSPYLGLNHRLTVGVNSSFTLGDLWRAVAGRAGEDLLGGKPLEGFNKDLEAFFRRNDPSNPLVAELARVFDGDVGRRLIALEMGRLSRDISELRKAGALLDNTRVRGMVGFVSNPVGDGAADRAAGGFQVGTETSLTLTKTQRALLENKAASLYAAGLRLQTRLLELTRLWQSTVAELLEARWEAELGLFMAANAPDAVLAKDGAAKAVEAQARYHQAMLRYNMLTGRSPDAAIPFAEANPNDLDYLFLTLGKALADPARLGALLARLGPSGLPAQDAPFNVLDWVPWVEKVTFWVGTQLQDMLAGQVLGGGVSIRLPVYDPTSPRQDRAFVLQSKAAAAEMVAAYREMRARAEDERLQVAAADASIGRLAAEGPEAARAVADAIRAYRNNLIGQDELWAVFRRWHWTVSRLVEARSRASLLAAWEALDRTVAAQGPERGGPAPAPATPVAGLEQALDLAASGSASLDALARRSEAARELLEAAGRRVEKVAVDVNLGVNITAAGVAWIPALGLTGFGAYPIVSVRFKPEELRQLESDRRRGEGAMYDGLRAALTADLAGELYSAYAALRAADEALAVLEGELLPAARRAAEGGAPEARRALLELETRWDALRGERAQLAATVNHLLGRAPGAPVAWGQDADAALASLKAKAGTLGGLEARRTVLAERIRVARDVEVIVDKNLRVQDLRLDPVSLVGRSLGRLVAALSGSGDASPELVALARQQVLEAEADQRAFERGLAVDRARLAFELARSRRRLAELERAGDPASRFEAALLRGRLRQAEAQLALLGGADGAAPRPSASPRAWDALVERLAAAFRGEARVPGLGDGAGFVPEADRWSASGTLRYYDARQTIAQEPIGKRFVEGWVEVRLGSRSTPPEALLALAALQEERAQRLFDSVQARAEAGAAALAARLRLDAGLLRWARSSKDPAHAALAARLEASLARSLEEASAHLNLAEPLTVDALLAMVPLSESAAPSAAADSFRLRADALGLEAVRRQLFADGLPAGLEGSRDSIIQLKADLVASRMSYKGFTPVGAFGMFRGRWVAGAFLEAPDPESIRNTLEGLVADALRRELESQDRMNELALRLHGLMAAVADGSRLLEARGARLAESEASLSGTLVRLERGMASAEEADAARADASAALDAFLDATASLRTSFVRLVAELKALGQAGVGSGTPAPTRRPRIPEARSAALSELARWTAGRMADPEFARRLAELFDGSALAPGRDTAELAELAGWYRRMSESAALVRAHPDFTPEERLALLTKADVEGRRLLLERKLAVMLAGVESGTGAGWEALRRFLKDDLDARADAALAEGLDRRALYGAVRRGAAAALPERLRPTAEALAEARGRADEARSALLASYLSSDQAPEDFLYKDKLLDEYLRRLTDYDKAVLDAFGSDALKGDPASAQLLDAYYSLRESAARRAALLRKGRGLLAAEALLGVENARLESLRRERASPEALDLASRRVAELEGLRARWLSRPSELDSVSAVLDGQGRVERWVTGSDLAGLERAGRVARLGGESWVLPAERAGQAPADASEALSWGARRVRGGLDAAEDAAAAARRRAEAARAAAETAERLETAPFVLTGPDGRPGRALDLSELRRLEAEGRVLYFAAKPDRDGLRRALHPLEARRRAPGEVVTVVVEKGEVPPAGRFDTLDAALRSPEGAGLRRLATGALGLKELAREAEREAESSARLGWVTLKLEAYGFALDAEGKVVAVFMTADEMTKAEADRAALKPEDPKRGWRLHPARDAYWELAEDGTLAGAGVAGEVRVRFSGSGPVARRVEGGVVAVELDAQGRLARVFQDEPAFKAASARWWIEDLDGRLWKQEDGRIAPLHRLKRYIDPETRLPVRLGWELLKRRVDEAADELGDVGRWAYMPWNWGNIVLEVPRGIVSAPIELITGRDPTQNGYLGRVYMYRRDGGGTERRGAFGSIVHFLDIFEILPDPVDRYMDPSQFPREVFNAEPLRPGEWEHEAGPHTDRQDIHFGAGTMLRFLRWAREDMEDARGRALGAFDGGVRAVFVETVRGRAGDYSEARVEYRTGADAVEAALREAGEAVGVGGDGRLEAAPDHVEVSRVTADLSVSLGQRQLAERAASLRAAARALEETPRTDRAAELSAEAERLEAEAAALRGRAVEARRALSAVRPPLEAALLRSAFPVKTLVP